MTDSTASKKDRPRKPCPCARCKGALMSLSTVYYHRRRDKAAAMAKENRADEEKILVKSEFKEMSLSEITQEQPPKPAKPTKPPRSKRSEPSPQTLAASQSTPNTSISASSSIPQKQKVPLPTRRNIESSRLTNSLAPHVNGTPAQPKPDDPNAIAGVTNAEYNSLLSAYTAMQQHCHSLEEELFYERSMKAQIIGKLDHALEILTPPSKQKKEG